MSIVSLFNELTDQVVPSMAVSRRAKTSLLPAKVNIWESATAFTPEAMMADWAVRDEVYGAREVVGCPRDVLSQ